MCKRCNHVVGTVNGMYNHLNNQHDIKACKGRYEPTYAPLTNPKRSRGQLRRFAKAQRRRAREAGGVKIAATTAKKPKGGKPCGRQLVRIPLTVTIEVGKLTK
jgi:hypothetical protein